MLINVRIKSCINKIRVKEMRSSPPRTICLTVYICPWFSNAVCSSSQHGWDVYGLTNDNHSLNYCTVKIYEMICYLKRYGT